MRRRLDQEIVRRGLLPSRARAAEAIAAGLVTVGGAPATSQARQVDEGEAIRIEGAAMPFVSRGGLKLAAALDHFAIEPQGLRCLDAGASTGGFTDCLLQRGAQTVVAVDVGRGQLAWKLRNDPRVEVLERTNIRALESIGAPADLAVGDLSFISLLTVAAALERLTTTSATLILLVKPQFEAGRARIGKGGIVRDPDVHRAVLGEVVQGLLGSGLVASSIMVSPLKGADGNVEFLLNCSKDGKRLHDDRLDEVVAIAHRVDGAGAGGDDVVNNR